MSGVSWFQINVGRVARTALEVPMIGSVLVAVRGFLGICTGAGVLLAPPV